MNTKERINIFRNEFSEFQALEDEQIRQLIQIYDHNVSGKYVPSDPPIAIVGGLLLWVGWLFFNSSSGYEIVDVPKNAIPQRIVLNTFIAPSASALTFALFE